MLTGFNRGDAVVPGADRRRTSAVLGAGGRRSPTPTSRRRSTRSRASPARSRRPAPATAASRSRSRRVGEHDVPAISIVNCTGLHRHGPRDRQGQRRRSPAGRRAAPSRHAVTDAGYALTFGGTAPGHGRRPLSVSNASGDRRHRRGDDQGRARHPAGGRPPRSRHSAARRHVQRHRLPGRRSARLLAAVDIDSLGVDVTGATGSSARPPRAARSRTRATSRRRPATTPRWSPPERATRSRCGRRSR